MSTTAKILIKEATCHKAGGGATVETVGSALMEVYSVRCGVRLGPNRCGPSQEIDRSDKVIEYVKLAGKEYVVEQINDVFATDREALADGCEYEVTVDIKDGIMFEADPPIEIIRLIKEYR